MLRVAVRRLSTRINNLNVDPEEINKFSRISSEWWDPRGKFAGLHSMNTIRVEYIKRHLLEHFPLLHTQSKSNLNSPSTSTPTSTSNPYPHARPSLEGLHILDLGCGGGLLSESLGGLGARVLGIDASPLNISVAQTHLTERGSPLAKSNITYSCITSEELLESPSYSAPSPSSSPSAAASSAISLASSSHIPAAKGAEFDCVCSLEVIEHVPDPHQFFKTAAKLVKPGGCLFISTLNRTPKSFALAIVAAEYVFRLVDTGTHDWNKFVRPEELQSFAHSANMRTAHLQGLFYNPILNQFSYTSDTDVNYIAKFVHLTPQSPQ